MISKLITHGKDRTEAIQRMVRAIDDYKITGCQTTLGFCRWAIQHEAFVSGHFDTHFVKKYYTPEVLVQANDNEEMIAVLAAVAALEQNEKKATSTSETSTKVKSRWKAQRLN